MKTPAWQTRHGEQEVGIGDFVALSSLVIADAKGVIVAAADDGRPVVLLGGHDAPRHGKRPLVIEEDHLLLLLRKAGGSETIDTKRF